jgi:hypothetical protein
MTPKIALIIVTVGAALAFAVPAGAQSSVVACPQSTQACQPVGARPINKTRSHDARLKIQPKLQGNGTWRVGSHIMY